MPKSIVELQGVKNFLGGRWVHQGVDLNIHRGEILGIVGSSGSGKTTLLRNILMLLRPAAGSIRVFDCDLMHCTSEEVIAVQRRWGVTFQQNALFGGLTILENILFPINEFSKLDKRTKQEIALLKIVFAGLDVEVAHKYPAELSGGMLKRAALARAIALDPELLFLDEPTAGLDPKSASNFDTLVTQLRDGLELTIVIITHDLDTLWQVTDRVAFLGEGQVLAVENMANLVENPHPLIQDYFSGPRGYRRDILKG